MFVLLLTQPGVPGLVEERQADLGEIDELEVEGPVGAGLIEEPGSYVMCEATETSAGYDYLD